MIEQQRLTQLSDLRTLGPEQFHPQIELATQIQRQDCERLGIMSPNFGDYTTMSAYIFPRTSLIRLNNIALVNNLLYYVDDLFDRHDQSIEVNDRQLRQMYELCFHVLATGERPEPSNNILDTCLEIYHRFKSTAPHPNWYKRLLRNLLEHLKSSTYEIDDIIMNEDRVKAYIHLRDMDSGMNPEIDMIEYAYGIYIPDHVFQHPQVSQATMMCARLAGLMNDVFSYEKEVIVQGSRFNFLAVLMDFEGLTFTEAVDRAVQMLNEFSDTFAQLEAHIPDFGDPNLNRSVALYYQGLHDIIIGAWFWQIFTDRYASPTSPFLELRRN
jgi:hypothetical protein